jgi:hypothetical protein
MRAPGDESPHGIGDWTEVYGATSFATLNAARAGLASIIAVRMRIAPGCDVSTIRYDLASLSVSV